MTAGTSTVTAALEPERSWEEGRIPSLWVRVEEGPDAGLTASSTRERLVIGTHPGADLVLRDRTVSRYHCELRPDGRHIHVRDLGSRNGTLLGAVGVSACHIRGEGTLRLGRTRLRFGMGEGSVTLHESGAERFGSLVGRSQPMRRVFALLEQAARSNSTVLLLGETGTGKEEAAAAIHAASPRARGPFVVVDCGAVPSDLLESELFGHTRGAFTGAAEGREGSFAAADGGTLFLDEVGELSPELQPKLLRALESRRVKAVGSDRSRAVDVRVIAATHRELTREVNQGRFRADLFYRLAVLDVTLPPLRDHPEDLEPLVHQLLRGMDVGGDHPLHRDLVDERFLAELAHHDWPGNVRELRNYLERCLAWRATKAPVRAALPKCAERREGTEPLRTDLQLAEARDEWNRHFERIYLAELLERHGHNVTRAARTAGVHRTHLHRLLRRHELR